MRGYLLSRFKSSVVLKINSYPGSSERMAADRSKDTSINCSPPDHSVRLSVRHCPAGRLFLTEGLKERFVRFKVGFFQVIGNVILGLVVNRHLLMFAALF